MRIKHDIQKIRSKRLEELNGGDIPKGKESPANRRKKPLKKKSTKVIKGEIDRLFSKVVRLRDTDENGHGNCCTCGKPLSLIIDGQVNINAQCGHFIVRDKRPTRWDLDNSNLQCGSPCNHKLRGKGEQYKHSLFINKKHGYNKAQELEELSREPFKESRIELYRIHAELTELYKKLLTDKNFKL